MLNTGLDMESLSICVRLCEQGINPEALSAVIKELRKASESLKVQISSFITFVMCFDSELKTDMTDDHRFFVMTDAKVKLPDLFNVVSKPTL